MKISVQRIHQFGYFVILLAMGACSTSRPATPSVDLTDPAPGLDGDGSNGEAKSASLRDGVFSQAQVERGEEVFERVCLECHQPEAFVGSGFLSAWSGRTVDVLFQEIRETMPENAPGRLSRREYAAILAYVFKLNGLPTGENDMPNRPQQLKEIRIESPIKPGNE